LLPPSFIVILKRIKNTEAGSWQFVLLFQTYFETHNIPAHHPFIMGKNNYLFPLTDNSAMQATSFL
jgi:hypothetical protein